MQSTGKKWGFVAKEGLAWLTMEIAFSGTYSNRLDEKSRISPPAPFKKVLGGRKGRGSFFLTEGLDGCLFLYPASERDNVMRRLKRLPFWKEDNRRFARMFLQHGYEVTTDGQGRIKIPQKLVGIAKLRKEVLFVGVGDRIEIWNPQVYAKYMKSGKVSLAEAGERVFESGSAIHD